MKYSDTELRELIINKDRRAMTQLFEQYSTVASGMAYRIGGTKFDLDEIIQDVFMKVFDKIHMYDPAKATIFTWIATLSRNHAIDEMRRLRSRERSMQVMLAEHMNDMMIVEPDDECMFTSLNIGGMVLDLAPLEKRIVELRYFKGMKFKDVAVELQLPLGSIKATNFRAIRKLRNMLGLE